MYVDLRSTICFIFILSRFHGGVAIAIAIYIYTIADHSLTPHSLPSPSLFLPFPTISSLLLFSSTLQLLYFYVLTKPYHKIHKIHKIPYQFYSHSSPNSNKQTLNKNHNPSKVANRAKDDSVREAFSKKLSNKEIKQQRDARERLLNPSMVYVHHDS